ncbi:hypothetical protein ACFO3J_07460 [Streptomyces polygonati]|uniref:Uncharacterized protein n=1 Tax=Streptomyces polygonati TaxID=1617087 RepID=A0ABV8HIA7_9ACTN
MRTALGREVDAGWVRERIYATLTMLAVVVALAEEDVTRLEAAISVLATAVGVWLTGLVAEEQAHRAAHGRLAGKAELRRMLYVTSPLLNSAISPLVMIAVSALGLLFLSTALYVSAALDALSLFGWSYYSGLRMGAGAAASTVAGLINIGVGAGIIVVKLLAH